MQNATKHEACSSVAVPKMGRDNHLLRRLLGSSSQSDPHDDGLKSQRFNCVSREKQAEQPRFANLNRIQQCLKAILFLTILRRIYLHKSNINMITWQWKITPVMFADAIARRRKRRLNSRCSSRRRSRRICAPCSSRWMKMAAEPLPVRTAESWDF